jgi:hypothetical protein
VDLANRILFAWSLIFGLGQVYYHHDPTACRVTFDGGALPGDILQLPWIIDMPCSLAYRWKEAHDWRSRVDH